MQKIRNSPEWNLEAVSVDRMIVMGQKTHPVVELQTGVFVLSIHLDPSSVFS
jgi:hypothetical protein